MKKIALLLIPALFSCSNKGNQTGTLPVDNNWTDVPFADMATSFENMDWHKHANTRYGLDRHLSGTGTEYVSVASGKSTTVNARVAGAARTAFSAWRVNTLTANAAVTLPSADYPLPTDDTPVLLSGRTLGASTNEEKNSVRVEGVSTGTVTPTPFPAADLLVVAYKEASKRWLYLRAVDPAVPATAPRWNPSEQHVKDYLDRVYNQAVVNINLTSKTTWGVSFDRNKDGFLDYAFLDGLYGAEMDDISSAVNTEVGSTTYDAITVYVQDVSCYGELSRNVAAGATQIHIFGDIDANWQNQTGYFIVGTRAASEDVVLSGCTALPTTATYPGTTTQRAEFSCNLSAPMATAKTAGSDRLIFAAVAGVQPGGAIFNLNTTSPTEQQTMQVWAHESGHRFGMADVLETDEKNVMSYNVNDVGGEFLSIRGEVEVFTGSSTPSGGTAYQWPFLNLGSNVAY